MTNNVRLCRSHEPHDAHDYLAGDGGSESWRCPGVRSVTRRLAATPAEEVLEALEPLELDPSSLYAEHTGRLELLDDDEYLGRLEAELGVTFGSVAWRGFVVGALWFAGPRRLRELLESPAELAVVRSVLRAHAGEVRS